jgi:transcriptional regulator with XRE-family HTH domain
VATRTIEVADLVVEIERRMDECRLTANATAQALDISPQRLSQWRRGAAVHLDADLQRRLAAFLDVSPRKVLALLGYDTSDVANLSAGNRPFPGLLCGKRLTLSTAA